MRFWSRFTAIFFNIFNYNFSPRGGRGFANDYATCYCIKYKYCKSDYGGGKGLKMAIRNMLTISKICWHSISWRSLTRCAAITPFKTFSTSTSHCALYRASTDLERFAGHTLKLRRISNALHMYAIRCKKYLISV